MSHIWQCNRCRRLKDNNDDDALCRMCIDELMALYQPEAPVPEEKVEDAPKGRTKKITDPLLLAVSDCQDAMEGLSAEQRKRVVEWLLREYHPTYGIPYTWTTWADSIKTGDRRKETVAG